LFVFVFFSFTPALKALVSAKVTIFFLKIKSQIFIFPNVLNILSTRSLSKKCLFLYDI
jgi:hypothetical protein